MKIFCVKKIVCNFLDFGSILNYGSCFVYKYLHYVKCIYSIFKCQPIFSWLAGESDDLKQTIKSLESRNMELEDKVQRLDKASSEKDTLIEKYKIEYKEGENL